MRLICAIKVRNELLCVVCESRDDNSGIGRYCDIEGFKIIVTVHSNIVGTKSLHRSDLVIQLSFKLYLYSLIVL